MTSEITETAMPSALPLPGHELVDLSLTLAEDLPCHWSTHQPFQHKTWTWFSTKKKPEAAIYNREGAPYTTRWMALDEHTGTHFDAPSHFIPPPDSGLDGAGAAGEITAEKVPLRQLSGPAVVIDVSSLAAGAGEPGVSPLIGPEFLTGWEEKHDRLRPPQVVLLRTGWDRHYLRGPEGSGYLYDIVVMQSKPGWPSPGPEFLDLLLERGIRCVGIDAPSMGSAHDGAAAHVHALSTGAVFVECLTGLGQLPPTGAWFCFLPLKVEGGTGAPGRAIAFVPS